MKLRARLMPVWRTDTRNNCWRWVLVRGEQPLESLWPGEPAAWWSFRTDHSEKRAKATGL